MTLVDIHGNPITPTVTTAVEALAAQGMTSSTFLGPSAPIYPADGVSRMPRGFEFPAGYNISARPRSKSRMSFYAMKMLIENYDIIQIAIRHTMNSITSYDHTFVPMEGFEGDLSKEITEAKRFFRKPDGVNYFRPWLRKYLKSLLRYDAGTLYRMRLNSGRLNGLKVINGETIAPLIDGWGDRPSGDAPAYVQFVNGITWNWLRDSDIIYQPYAPDDDSPYGSPPVEGIVTAANTDLRIQLFLMQTFTEGNIPAGFGLAPETWTPDQIIDFQAAFDAFTTGNPEARTQIRFVPGGMALQFPTLTAFDSGNQAESKWLMQKVAAMFSKTPDDLGFTQDSNRSVGESQADVSNKVGDVPLAHHLEEILNGVLQDDLGLPLEFAFDLGGEEEDRLATAKADTEYVNMGAVSPSTIAELRFGIVDVEPIPRFINNAASGPIAIASLFAASPPVDGDTALPLEGSVQPATPQLALEAGTLPIAEVAPAAAPIAKSEDAEGGATVGINSDTGYYGNPLKSGTDEDDEEQELAKFRKFAKSRQRLGKWWDFEFASVDQVTAHRLNVAGYGLLRKAAGEVVAAGLAVLAADTGRVLMLQRSLDPDDRASGLWEFPGGCLEAGESPADAAVREWCEETGLDLPDGVQSVGWTSPSGIYQGFCLVVPSEFPLDARAAGTNPDDPDGDFYESLAWWSPSALVGNPVIRPELAADASIVMAALTSQQYNSNALAEVAPEPCACCSGSGEHDTGRECYGCDASGLASGFTGTVPCDGAFPSDVVKMQELPLLEGDSSFARGYNARVLLQREIASRDTEADAAPLVEPLAKSWRDDTKHPTPQHDYDLKITDHYSSAVTDGLMAMIASAPIESVISSAGGLIAKATAEEMDAVAQAVRAQLADVQLDSASLEQTIRQIIADGYLAGGHAGMLQVGAHAVTLNGATGAAVVNTDWGAWEPGDVAAALKDADGGLKVLLDNASITIKGVQQSTLDSIGNKISDGLLNGDSSDAIARKIREEVGSKTRADMIAHTETTRAVTSATLDTYRVNDIAEWDLLTADDVSDECADVAAANPHPLSDTDDAPPIHPFCRCSAAPH
jgi:SPP1 gp7 family putative phage head morphogenesis protein